MARPFRIKVAAGGSVIALLTLFASAKVIAARCPKVNGDNGVAYIAHEIDCSKFYVCDSDGAKTVTDCPEYNEDGDRLWFNDAFRVCDWPELVDCRLPKPGVLFQESAKISYACPGPDSEDYTLYLADETDCAKFYKCDHGRKIPMECPEFNDSGDKLHFNAAVQLCDWPELVDCENYNKIAVASQHPPLRMQ